MIEETEKNENILSDDESSTPLVKPKKGRPKNPPKIKEKKERTEAQKEVFKRAQAKIIENRAKRAEEKKIESAKLLLEKGIELPSLKQEKKIELPSKKEEEESDEEQEIVYMKKPKSKSKPKKKKIIVYQDSSSEESSSEEEQEIHIRKSKHFKTQQNKKSLIKVHQQTPVQQPQQQINYFCD